MYSTYMYPEISCPGVECMKGIFGNVERGFCGNKVLTRGVVIVAGSDSPIVIPLTGTLHHNVVNHFMETQEISEADAKQISSSRYKWFGVLDDMQRFMELNE